MLVRGDRSRRSGLSWRCDGWKRPETRPLGGSARGAGRFRPDVQERCDPQHSLKAGRARVSFRAGDREGAGLDRLPPKIVRRLILVALRARAVHGDRRRLAAHPRRHARRRHRVLLRAPARHLPTTRLVAFLLSYVALEVVGIVWMFVLWIASGFGATMRGERMQQAHYAFMRTWLSSINNVARKLFHLRVKIEDPPTPRTGPVLVFSRHAGPGNSLLLVGTLLIGYHRQPRIVMLAKLQWEPLYDIMLNRLPNRFIKHDPKRRDLYIETIADLGVRARRQRRVRPLPRGQGLHAEGARARDRLSAQQGLRLPRGPGRGDDARPAAAAQRRDGGDERVSRSRGRLRRALRARGHRDVQRALVPDPVRPSDRGALLACHRRARSRRTAMRASHVCSIGGNASTRGSRRTSSSTTLRAPSDRGRRRSHAGARRRR